MRGPITEYLPVGHIELDVEAADRGAVLEHLSTLLGGRDPAVREAVRDGLRARERGSSTGVGGGIAFPHARVAALPRLRLALLRTREPVAFAALDGEPVDLFVGMAAPAQDRIEHLAVLSSLSYLFRSGRLRQEIRDARLPQEVLDILGQSAADNKGVDSTP